MSIVAEAPEPRTGPKPSHPSKRETILDAAETCFVRSGFHRATMQDIAREAAMSPANMYRYFGSKEAIVQGLADRDCEQAAELLAECAGAVNRYDFLVDLLRRYFTELTRADAVLRLEIWAEGTRNPDFAAMLARSDAEARDWFMQILRAIAPAGPDPAAFYDTLALTMKGMIVNRATLPGDDPALAVAHLLALLDAGLADRDRHTRTERAR